MHHRRFHPAAGFAPRLCGGAMLALLWFAGGAFSAAVDAIPPDVITPLELISAIALFLSGSLGAALLVLGAHLFDPVEISSRWKML